MLLSPARDNGQAKNRILVVEAVDVQCVDALEQKLRGRLPTLWIVWRFAEVENEKGDSEVASRSRNDCSLKE